MNILFLEQRPGVLAYFVDIFKKNGHIVYEAENFGDASILDLGTIDVFILGDPDWEGLSCSLTTKARELNQNKWPNYFAPFVWFKYLVEQGWVKWQQVIF